CRATARRATTAAGSRTPPGAAGPSVVRAEPGGLVRPVAEGLDRRQPAPAQRDGATPALDRGAVGPEEVDVAADQDRAVRVGRDGRALLSHGRVTSAATTGPVPTPSACARRPRRRPPGTRRRRT